VKLHSGLSWQNNIQLEQYNSHQQGGVKFRKETSKVPHLEHSSLRCWNLDTGTYFTHPQAYKMSQSRRWSTIWIYTLPAPNVNTVRDTLCNFSKGS